MPSNQLIDSRLVIQKWILILSLKVLMRSDELPVIMQLSTCKAKMRMCSAILAMNTPQSASI